MLQLQRVELARGPPTSCIRGGSGDGAAPCFLLSFTGKYRERRSPFIPSPGKPDSWRIPPELTSQIQDDEPRRFVMSAPIPLRRDFDASQLCGFARKTKDGPQARRLLALAAIYDGGTRTEAAKIGGVGLQIIRDW